MSRQTSRIVWPSRPSTTRPSTSRRMAGVDCGRCGACVRRSRSARLSATGSGGVDGARSGGREIRSAIVRSSPTFRWRRLPAGSGCRRRRGRCPAGCGRRSRARSIASRSGAGSGPGARGRTGRSRRSRRRGPPGASGRWAGRCRRRSAGRSRRGGAARSGRGSSCRRPRRRRSGRGAGRGRRCRSGSSATTMRARSRRGRPRRAGPPKLYGVSSSSAGRRPPVGPPTRTALKVRPAATPPARSRISRRVVPVGDLRDPRRRDGARHLHEDRAGRVRVADRAERVGAVDHDPGRRRRGSPRCGRASGGRRGPRSDGYGGRCSGWPRFPSRALSRTVSSPSM